ncbi:PKD domain-containing protein [Kitasatospora sp. NPDC048239]|uniref:PKD domain-containing protein n=1 Tax=Kitasatospora sp. NPDC048239 TaxID=3364046 RepID=UPI0037246780
MRPHRAKGLLAAGLVTVLGGLPTATTASASTTGPTDEASGVLRVDGWDPACSDSGTGTAAKPFCSVNAATAAALPGQTVEVARSAFGSDTVITKSGEPGRPLTIRGAAGTAVGGDVRLSGVHDVVVESMDAREVQITGSSRVTVVRTEASGIKVTDSPGTTLTNNTVTDGCTTGIELAGDSSGSNIFNNVVVNHFSPAAPYSCPNPAGAEIVVSTLSAKDTRAGSNTVAPYWTNFSNGTPYLWAGTRHETPESLAAATDGRAGEHDYVVARWVPGNAANSEVVDSADETAPGFVPAAHPADDPWRPNLGTGLGYHDRGASERQEPISVAQLTVDHQQAPYGTEITMTATTGSDSAHWPTSVMSYRYDFGDGTPQVTSGSRVVKHTYAKAGTFYANVTVDTGGGQPFTGRYAVQVQSTTPGPLTARATVQQVVPDQFDTADAPPLGVKLDPSATSSPWPVSTVVVDYGDGSPAVTRNTLDATVHGYASPGDYTVTVTVTDTAGRTSTAAYPFRAAYAPTGFLRTEPYRLADTREDPNLDLAGGREVPFTLPTGTAPGANGVPGNVTTVVLNVTVTGATEDTHLTVWPTGQARPITSNVNVAAGRTSSNLVTVPIGDAKRISTLLNAGRAEVIVDVVGFYRPNGGHLFTPLPPSRLVDTRDSGKLGSGETRAVKVAGVGGVPADATSVVLNLTSTETAVDTHLKVYAGGGTKPVSSNLNPEPGKDKSNQVVVPVGPDGTVNVYNHNGSTHVILDVFGYYSPNGKAKYTPTVPVRLTDTRTTPFAKPGPDSTTTVTGIPAGARAAVLNVTSTNTTEDSYLTVHAHGAARPGTSNLNLLAGQTVPNHVTTPVDANGSVDIYNHVGSTDVIADLFGYYTDAWPKP